ncbi:Mov34/MPN/PAD-1 family protein [Sphingomonas sp. PAMC 26605]|uniref:Mov34/MPN/PAD-1 family protein n=1 Tax=Sphingomonas sp. PAMC 26605 TaxID=1112214 RepID=UPI00068634F5|nr:Mov34/MPN/PAD-1 family protein [Sphingomonas sp. PAMC 26605]
MSLRYPIGTSGEVVIVTDPALDHLLKHQQMRWWQREAGGLLFARIAGPEITIVEATGPHPKDLRSRFSFSTSLERQQAVVETRFDMGLHYVGDWHPEARPKPSPLDRKTMASRVALSVHGFAGFLFAIIGRDPLPEGLAMMFQDGTSTHHLQPAVALSTALPHNLDDAGRVKP